MFLSSSTTSVSLFLLFFADVSFKLKDLLITILEASLFPDRARQRRYVHIFKAVSVNAEERFAFTVCGELKRVSRNMACAWILNASREKGQEVSKLKGTF